MSQWHSEECWAGPLCGQISYQADDFAKMFDFSKPVSLSVIEGVSYDKTQQRLSGDESERVCEWWCGT